MGIIKTGKIQSHGDIVGLQTRIVALEDKYVKALWYAEIGSGTSGTITPPTNGTIVLNEWGNDVDAVTSTIVTGKKPDFVSAKTSAGAIVTATLGSNGAWTISGSPSAYPIAIVYVYEIKLINFDRAYSLYEEEFGQSTNPTDSPSFVGLILSGLTQSVPIVTDANKALTSLAYTGATSFRKNLGLEQDDSPTFATITGSTSDVAKLTLTNTTPTTGDTWYIRSISSGILDFLGSTGNPVFAAQKISNNLYVAFGQAASPSSSYGVHIFADASTGATLGLMIQNNGIGKIVEFNNSSGVQVTILNNGNTGFGGDTAPAEKVDVTGNVNITGVYKVDDVQVVSNRVIDARLADTPNSGDATTDGLIDALRDLVLSHGLGAAA